MNNPNDQESVQTTPTTCRELPRYKCHKEVHAIKIAGIKPDVELAKAEHRETTGGTWLLVNEEDYKSIHVESDWMKKHAPVAGGYYVVYADGYKSFSPAKSFEDGYTRIP